MRSSGVMEMQFVLYSTRGSTGNESLERKQAESTLTLLEAW